MNNVRINKAIQYLKHYTTTNNVETIHASKYATNNPGAYTSLPSHYYNLTRIILRRYKAGFTPCELSHIISSL